MTCKVEKPATPQFEIPVCPMGTAWCVVDHRRPSNHLVLPPEPPPEHPHIRLVARHCRSCDLVRFGRNDSLPHWESHDAPTPDGVPPTPCPKPDFGPEVVVCEVPW